MPNPHFVGLVQSVLASAEAVLGETYSPMTRHLARDGLLARRTAEKSLELLEMLLEKTRGNLDETERDLLTKAVGKLRRELAPLAEPGPSN
ncbi:DUF1844 domain-containing protein [soil metagenome]|jgi:hypothetical protein|nr:DUF1844 domain-containing protein [Deinococcota bacterium]